MKRSDGARTGVVEFAGVCSVALLGLGAQLVRVQAAVSEGPAAFQLVGLPEAQVREARVRVRAALQQLGIDLHEHAITVTINPPNLSTSGSFDLSIAVAVLVALGMVPLMSVQGAVFVGELSLTGAIRPVRGVLPMLHGAAEQNFTCAIIPRANANEAANVAALEILVAADLAEVVQHLQGHAALEPVGDAPPFDPRPAPGSPDLSEVRGQEAARRVLEVAVAGAHSLLLIAPAGSAKSMLARRLPSLLPPLTHQEALEVTGIASVAGLLKQEQGLITGRPFRAPHHTVSSQGLIGGGDPVRPGEVSLAHLGVLFLDELLEFRRNVLEDLGRALDQGEVVICRARVRTTFPGKPLLVGAVQPCPCGFAGLPSRRCTCTPERLRSYGERLRAPFFDRFDLRVVLPQVDASPISTASLGESSRMVQARVVQARARQIKRTSKLQGQMSQEELETSIQVDAASTKMLKDASKRHQLSGSGYWRVLRVARSIADLGGSAEVRAPHVAEALLLAAPFPSCTTTI